MRYPHDDFYTQYNTTAGYGFGAVTSYGFHEGVDVNDNLGGNSDLGKPIYAIADGVVTSVHSHSTKPTFGNHIHYKIDGPWGTRWVHHAHCNQILVAIGDQVKEGQLIARIGNSGTDWAHDHWAIKKQPTGIDAIAKTAEQLQMWEDPVRFVKAWMSQPAPPAPVSPAMTLQTIIPNRLTEYGQDLEIQQISGLLKDLKLAKNEVKNLALALSECRDSQQAKTSDSWVVQKIRDLLGV